MSEEIKFNESINDKKRHYANAVKDLHNTYKRNQEISDSENKHMEDSLEETKHETESPNSTQDEMLQKLTSEKNELKEQLLRQMAELDNFRRRTIKEKEELREYANHNLLLKFLPILDDLHAALEAGSKNSGDAESFKKGVEMIVHKADKIFEEAGVKPIEEGVGQSFNVELHEALAQAPSELPEGQIIQEVQRGYFFKDKVLRHTKVITSAGIISTIES